MYGILYFPSLSSNCTFLTVRLISSSTDINVDYLCFSQESLSRSILVYRLFRQIVYRTDWFGYMACGVHKMPC